MTNLADHTFVPLLERYDSTGRLVCGASQSMTDPRLCRAFREHLSGYLVDSNEVATEAEALERLRTPQVVGLMDREMLSDVALWSARNLTYMTRLLVKGLVKYRDGRWSATREGARVGGVAFDGDDRPSDLVKVSTELVKMSCCDRQGNWGYDWFPRDLCILPAFTGAAAAWGG